MCRAMLCMTGQACCSCLCLPAKLAGVAAENYSKISYVIIHLTWILGILIFSSLLQWSIGAVGADCLGDGSGTFSCQGTLAFLRLSFTLLVFHFVMVVILATRSQAAALFDDGCWLVKSLALTAIFVGACYIPSEPFFTSFFLGTSRFVSLAFVGYQALAMLVCAYALNERLAKNIELEGSTPCSCSAITFMAFFLVVTGLNITWFVYQVQNFAIADGCEGNLLLVIITGVCCLVLQLLPCWRTREDASELTSALAISFILFLQWSSFTTQNAGVCNESGHAGWNVSLRLALSLAVTFTALFQSAGAETEPEEGVTAIVDTDG